MEIYFHIKGNIGDNLLSRESLAKTYLVNIIYNLCNLYINTGCTIEHSISRRANHMVYTKYIFLCNEKDCTVYVFH